MSINIHTFGDSHSLYGWKEIPNINIHHLGPILCYSIGKDGLTRLNIKNYNVTNNDMVIFCFGEIDCRCHIYKHISENKSYEKIIVEIIDNYFKTIQQNILQFSNLRTYIYNVVPTVQKYNTEENPDYPYLGSDEERKQYVLYFNKILKEKCDEYKFGFFNIYKQYCDETGFLNKLLSDGHVHIKEDKYIKDYLNLLV